jgi:hypothetical protein
LSQSAPFDKNLAGSGKPSIGLISPRLSLERCRQILGSNCTLSDSELELLRDQLYGFANILVDSFSQKKLKHLVSTLKIPAELDERFQERAAILEFEAGFNREEAEKLAFEEIEQFLREAENS